MTIHWGLIFGSTLRTPRDAAEVILAVPTTREQIYTALIAGSALNALLAGLSLMLFPLPEEFPRFIATPFVYFLMAIGGVLVFTHLVTWSGRAMGGSGTLQDMLKLMVWLQFVRVTLNAFGFLLALAVPTLGGLYGIAVMVLSLWILLSFIQVGHRLASMGNAFLVVFITFVGLVIGLSVFLALIGVGSIGVSPNV